jgi:CDP-glycerol glycerophosphotransferase (TagB/SpsB family)
MGSQLKAQFIDGLLQITREKDSDSIDNLFCGQICDYNPGKGEVLPVTITKKEDGKLFLLQEIDQEKAKEYLHKYQMEKERNKTLREAENKIRSLREEICWFQKQLDDLEQMHLILETGTEKSYQDSKAQIIREQNKSVKLYEQAYEEHRGLLGLTGEQVQLNLESEESEELEFDPEEEIRHAQSYHIAVYSLQKTLYCVWGTLDQVYQKLVNVVFDVKKVLLNKKILGFKVNICAENRYGLDIGTCRLQIANLLGEEQNIPIVKVKPSNKVFQSSSYERTFVISTMAIADHSAGDDSPVPMEGSVCALSLMVDGVPVEYRLRKEIAPRDRWGFRHNQREKFVPIVSTYCEPCALHIRRSMANTFVLIKRYINPIERTPFFRFMESNFVSGLFYHLGRIMAHLPKHKKKALFYEKFSEKAEEGTFELFQQCSKSKKTKSYFIIDEHSPDYQRIKDTPGVVRKFSLKYYWLLANAGYYISTESPFHLSMLNANNHYIRLNFVRHPFIFLQHGVTYLKRQGNRSTFGKGKGGEAKYIVVSSEKERKVVSRMLKLNKQRVWNTGMMIFDKCEYKHLNQASPDKATIMLTWKPYEEHLENFENSSYFKYTMEAYELLQKYMPRENINIVGHPRVAELLKKTSIADLLWEKPISEVLAESKLLITDYSSVCWNAFYQGGGVVFLQPDLAEYEFYVGKLIPKNSEYIGKRVFDFEKLNQVFAEGIHDGVIDLSYYRTEENEKMYRTINEFSDGRNSERIYQQLVLNGIM